MKRSIALLGLAAALTCSAAAGETLRLKLEPDRNLILKGSPQEVVVKIGLEAAERPRTSKRTPLNLAVVLDRSGSMTGAKLEKAKQAAALIVDRLESDDVFALIAYSDKAEVLAPARRVNDRSALRRAVERISAGGSTALHAGVKTGASELREYLSDRRINRVILLSDGLANVGPSSTRDLRQLGRELSAEGIAVTTIGLGDDYNEDLMAGLAEASDANYYYVKDTETLPQIFARELGELMTIAARDVRIEIICPKGVKPLGFIGRSETFENQRSTVKLSHFTSGQERAVFLRCLVEAEEPDIASVKVAYVDEAQGGSQSASSAVRVAFTRDAQAAEQAVNRAVFAEKELIVTAVRKDEALAAADAGNYGDAAKVLKQQASRLAREVQHAPAQAQQQIRLEIQNLEDRSRQLEAGAYDTSTRKTMQSESYQMRNSKGAQ